MVPSAGRAHGCVLTTLRTASPYASATIGTTRRAGCILVAAAAACARCASRLRHSVRAGEAEISGSRRCRPHGAQRRRALGAGVAVPFRWDHQRRDRRVPGGRAARAGAADQPPGSRAVAGVRVGGLDRGVHVRGARQPGRSGCFAWGAYVALAGALLAIGATAWEPRSSAGGPGRDVLAVASLLLAGVGAVIGLAFLPARSWSPHARDAITVMSSDGRARAVAAIAWHHGAFPSGLRHRGAFTRDSVVVAVRPVACLWVNVHWDALLESVRSTPGYLVRCRKPGARKPPALSLAGLGDTRRLLNSATISVCVSNAKAEGPRWCGWQKVTYSPV